MESQSPFQFFSLAKEIPPVAKLMIAGLVAISIWVVWQFFVLILKPGPVEAGEDFYIHVAMLILVPGTTFGLCLVSFGYSYYQICKQQNLKPFWEDWMK